MSLGENIQFLRKRRGMTQEDFAEKLDVSRQTISKWESDTSYPEMEKLLALYDLFGCDLDTLTRGSAAQALAEDTEGYDREMNGFTRSVCAGVSLTLWGVAALALALCRGMNEALGAMAMMAFLLAAVAVLIVSSLRHGAFVKKHPEIRPFYRQEQIDGFDRKFPFLIAVPTTLILLGIIALMGTEAFPRPVAFSAEQFEYLLTAAFMALLALSVPMYVYGGMQKYKYDIQKYNETNAPTEENARKSRLKGRACGILMMLATVVYLVMGLGYDNWRSAAVIYAAAGLLCGVASVVINGLEKRRGPAGS